MELLNAIQGVTSIASTVLSLVQMIKNSKAEKEVLSKEKIDNHFEFYKHIVLNLSDFYVRVDYKEYMNEIEYDIEGQAQLATEGLIIMNVLIPNLINFDYFKDMDKTFRLKMIELNIQCKRDLIYYEKYYLEDHSDPSEEVIDSIRVLYEQALKEICE
ncbi:hypothetical protein [Paenibacillus amylolyticus]|uniref:GHKL domain protein n=1 Tax=Paenibacillus amylolyticus TaxID=1451 RepID=A0A100VIC9_PAEAM|nr:hypothetical protein [Paenibacillus amylolyticus]GAS80366.1 GHKL domain protein [Paenibacillus amylolyticus]